MINITFLDKGQKYKVFVIFTSNLLRKAIQPLDGFYYKFSLIRHKGALFKRFLVASVDTK